MLKVDSIMKIDTYTKKELITINSMSIKDKTFFDKHFYKVSPRMFASDLKHYTETYSINDVEAIIMGQPER